MTDLLSTAREATSDRITLGVTAVLTLSAISLDSRSDLPKVEYSRRKTIGEKEEQRIRANLEYVVIIWVEIFLFGQHPPQPGALCHRPGLVHHLLLPLLHGLHPRVRRGALLHQGGFYHDRQRH